MSEGKISLLIDTDPGVDDAMAILAALNCSQVEVIGVTTLFGNVTTDTATKNALRLVEMAGMSEVPVVQGAAKALTTEVGEPRIADFVHGKDGFGDTNLPPPKGNAASGSAAEFIVRTIRQQPGCVVILALAALTNIAEAIKLDPEIGSLWRDLIVLGGAFYTAGNVNPAAEANFYGDPLAADIVLGASEHIKVVGLDVTHHVVLTDNQLQQLQHKGRWCPELQQTTGSFLSSAAQFYLGYHKIAYPSLGGVYCHDPTAFTAVVAPDLFEWRRGAVRVVSEGFARGHAIMDDIRRVWVGHNDWLDRPKVQVAVAANGPAISDLVIERLSTEHGRPLQS
eukprot:jgi/Chrzof1/14822/Cz09g17180.t1